MSHLICQTPEEGTKILSHTMLKFDLNFVNHDVTFYRNYYDKIMMRWWCPWVASGYVSGVDGRALLP